MRHDEGHTARSHRSEVTIHYAYHPCVGQRAGVPDTTRYRGKLSYRVALPLVSQRGNETQHLDADLPGMAVLIPGSRPWRSGFQQPAARSRAGGAPTRARHSRYASSSVAPPYCSQNASGRPAKST